MAKAKKTKVRTQVCFLLDETQSMLPRKEETLKGINGYIQSLKKDQGGEVLFTLTTFNRGEIRERHTAVEIGKVKELSENDYNPKNWTPLYDAIGTTICAIEKKVGKEDLVIFTILTDGEENSSKEYSLSAIKDLIKKYETQGWKFVFLGVGVDAFAGGSSIGLQASSTFTVAPQNMGMAYNSVSEGTANLRAAYASQGLTATASMSVVNEKDRKKLSDKA